MYDQNRAKVQKEHNVSKNLDEMELFRVFKKYDRSMNGILDFNEYSTCLTESGLGLTKPEVVSSTICADIEQNGQIDFEEFMKHFKDILNMHSFNQQLTDLLRTEEEHLRQVQNLKEMSNEASVEDVKAKAAAPVGSSFHMV